jgi:hypothetical protein
VTLRPRATLAATLAVVLWLATSTSRAEEAPYSPYERETIDLAAKALRAEVDPAPEGKTIEAVVLRPLDVFEPRDPLPEFFEDFLNLFHVTTRPWIIEREVLQKVGDKWDQRLVDETARNLRSIRQLSLVLCVPLKSKDPDKVRLLVITKDIWSLRLNSDFRIANDQLEYLLLAPSEENLAGLHHSVGARFVYHPDTYTFGVSYRVPRIGTSWIEAVASTNVAINHDTGAFEGTSGGFAYGQPLYSTRTEWAWVASIKWLTEVTRFFQGTDLILFDAESTPQDDRIPLQYDTEEIAGAFTVVRSFGSGIKHDVSFGAEAGRFVYRMIDRDDYAPEAAREFEAQWLPVSDARVYPFIGYASYSTDFKSFIDLNTLGLQEDYRLGHDVFLKAYPVIEEIGSSRSFAGVAVGGAYTASFGDGLGRAYAQSTVEAAPERVYDAALVGGLRLVSPRLGFGRLVADGVAVRRFENYLNRKSTLGGEGRLRGYPSGAYRGDNVVAYNLELRSMPFELWTVQAGAVAFFDAGAAYDDEDDFDLKQSIGAGVRVVFPQLDRSVMRLDWAVPTELDPAAAVTSIFPGRFTITFKQAFPMPAIAPPSVLD